MGSQGSQTVPERWRAVLFDLDGTLADTVDLILRSFRHTMRTHTGVVPPDSQWLATIGRPLRDSLRLFAESPDEVAAMTRTYVTYQRSIHDELVRPYPEIPETLARLSGEGIPLAVVTSKRREMALRTLDRCGLGGFFQEVVCADEVERGKPDPEPVVSALSRLGLAPGREVLFVGDSVFDLRAGRGAGVSTGAALWGPIHRSVLSVEDPDHSFERPAEIPEFAPPPAGGRRGLDPS
jgi:pyrophosphatase PpaX